MKTIPANKKLIRLLLAVLLLSSVPCCKKFGRRKTAKDLSGEYVSSDLLVEKWVTEAPNLQGKFLIVDFWRTWCVACLSNIKKLSNIQDRFRDRIAVVGITNESPDVVEKSLKIFRPRYAIGIDSQERLEKEFQVRAFPTVFIIDPKGIVRWEGVPSKNLDNLTEEKVAKIIADYSR